MKKQNAEAALEALKKALKRGDEVGAYLCCGQLLGELLALCYPADAPPLGERFVRLPETELGQKLRGVPYLDILKKDLEDREE